MQFLGEINDLYVKQSPAGPYFLGEELSAADIAIVPFLVRFDATLPFYRGVDALMAVRVSYLYLHVIHCCCFKILNLPGALMDPGG